MFIRFGSLSEKMGSQYLTHGKSDVKKIKPFLLTMPDNQFWAIGECLGSAWNVGKKIKEAKE